MGESEQTFEFGPYHLIPRRRLLLSGAAPVPVGGRAFDILVALVERHEQVVSKDELMREVWGGQVVEDNTLAVQLSALRKVLGDGTKGIRYIGTVPGRGYRFVAPVARGGESEPAAPAVSALAGNLPRADGALIGREAPLARVMAMLGEASLVTLAGAGGIGKTRLALAIGAGLRAEYPDGVWWVELAPVVDPALVPDAVARALGLQLNDAPPLPQLAAALRGGRRLVILDNCEHVAGAVAELAVALRPIAGLRLLATSQEPLGVEGEQVERLEPLAVPEAATETAVAAGAAPATQLFVLRAKAVAQDFALDDANAGAVVQLCRRLDGLPLAIELAAARAALLGVEPVARRLDERLLELSAGRRDVLPKHQTLRALLDWSHGLLNAAEQTVLRRLSVFVGGCTLEAAEAVLSDAALPEWQVAEHVASLIGKSLLIVERLAQGARYRLLETTRAFAAEQLAAKGEADAIAERHARYFQALFEQAHEAWETTLSESWLERYQPELDNVRAALDWAFADPGRSALATALAGVAARMWNQANSLIEGRRYLDRAVLALDDATPPAVAARVLRHAGGFWVNTDRPRAMALLERSAALYLRSGDRLNHAAVLGLTGYLYLWLGRKAEAGAMLDAAYQVLVASAYQKSLTTLMTSRGALCMEENDAVGARYWFTEGLERARKQNSVKQQGLCLSNLAAVEFILGNVEQAVTLQRAALPSIRRSGTQNMLAWALAVLAGYLIDQDKPDEARPMAQEALSLAADIGGFVVWECLERWSMIGALEGRYLEAARLIGFVDAKRVQTRDTRHGAERQFRERLGAVLQANLPTAEVDAATAEAAQWTESQAVQFALANLIDGFGSAGDLPRV